MKYTHILCAALIFSLTVFTGACAHDSADTESQISEDTFYTDGYFLMSKSGTPMIVTESGPCTMSTQVDIIDLQDLTDGDRIRVSCGPVMETYPGRMEIYSIEKLSDGEMSDIDPDIIVSLTEMGWLEETQKTANELLGVSYIRTDGYHEFFTYPRMVEVTSVNELDAYYEAFSDYYNLGRRTSAYSDNTVGWLDAAEAYDENYFESYKLYMLILEEGSGSVRHVVNKVSDGVVTVEWRIPEVGTDDMAEWHILIEVEKDRAIVGIAHEDGTFIECDIYTVDEAIALLPDSVM